MTYVDTSVLFSLYVPDANSSRADAWRQANPAPIDFTGFHRIELRNALSLAMFHQRLTSDEAQAAWTQVQEDLKAGALWRSRTCGQDSFQKPKHWRRITRRRLARAVSMLAPGLRAR